jgi:diguanylate cyclase (GGDEF)-like protein
VQAQVPEAAALQALRAFKWILPATAGLAIAIAVLLASIFIRRSHAPLRLLADAARRIGEGRFGRTVSVSSSDEYGRLARAFNQMSRGLREQFQLLRVLARVDRTILARGGTQPAIRYLLRRLPGLLNCEHAGVLFYGNGSAQLIACSGHLTPIRCIDIAPTMSGLRVSRDIERRTHLDADARHVLEHFDSSASNTFYFVPVLIKNELRAHLIIGSAGEPASLRRLQDIAQRIAVALDNEQWERTLWEHAHTDSLTGLPNRLALHQHLNQAAQGAHAIGTVFFLDLDRFKTVNDSLGHSLGDSLLQQVASRWKAHLPSSSLLARVGGDEFVAVVPQTHSRQETEQLAQALIAALREPCQLNEMRYVAQASIGVAMYPDHGTDAETLLRHADIALYRAKSGGRGRARMFDASMSGDLSARLEIEHQLRDAIREGRIHPHYQPKLNTQGELVGVEALARWQKVDGKWISPGTFIPIAEESGLIAPMGELLLRNVCKQMRDWQDRGIPVAHAAVNVSMVQMRDPAFADFVLRCLAETGIEGAALEVELTESLFSEKTTDVARQLTRLAQAGVRVAIDDFGTGFSSMSLLRQYPIHSLKIDRSFVIECHHSVESRALLKALIDVGHALHLQVVAEGVEEITQLSVLHELNCDVLQGYLFAPALSAQALESFINDGEPIRETLRSAG